MLSRHSASGFGRGYRFAFALFIIFFFILFPLAGEIKNSQDLIEEGFKRYAENEYLELFFNEELAILALRMQSSGYIWLSSPLDWEEDDYAQGFFKNALPSLVQIRSRDKNGTIFPANSYTNVILRNGLKVRGIANGFQATHSFTRDGVTLPLSFTIDGPDFIVSLDIEKILLDDEWGVELIDFTLLPYFGAAPLGESGYIFVPDGSGTLIEFNQTGKRTTYEHYVYGRDPVIQPLQKRILTQDLMLPIFGLSREDAGYLAIIEKGAGRARILAEAAPVRTGYNSAYSGFIVRDYDVVTFRERTGTPRDVPIFETGPLKGGTLQVRYLFLEGGENNYVGMANAYRSYLIEKGDFPKTPRGEETSLLLNFIGASRKVKPVFGLPMNVTIPYTPFADAEDIIEELSMRGVDRFTVKYDGWLRGGLKSDYPARARPDKALGGKRGFRSFLQFAQEKNIPVFGSLDPVRLFRKSLFRPIERVVAKGMHKAPAKIEEYQLSTFTIKTEGRRWWIVRSEKVASWFKRFVKSMRPWDGLGLAPDSLSNFISSDFGSRRGYYRTESETFFKESLARASANGPLMLSRPFAYALGNVDYIADLPTESSAWDISTADIPFYQILLKGWIPFSNLPANRMPDRSRYLLSLLETGANPSYLFIAQRHEDLRDSPLEGFVNTLASDWLDQVSEIWSEALPVLRQVEGVSISAHHVYPDGLRRTDYSNGISIYINQTNGALSLPDGERLEAMAFRVYKEGRP